MHRIIFFHLPGVCVFLFLAVSLWFRVWKLGSVPGLNGDEAWFGNEMLYALRGEPFLWRTPHGNPLNPFWCLPLWALHTVFQPSFVLLRSLAVVSGCLALLVNFWLCKATYDKKTAWISTALLAVLPACNTARWKVPRTERGKISERPPRLLFLTGFRRNFCSLNSN